MNASGILFQCGDRVLLLKRSREGDAAGYWALPGGKLETGESTEQAAVRELREECRVVVDNPEKLKLLGVSVGPVVYTTFRARVDKPFHPRLNDEHTDYQWARLDALPEPLHPGVVKTLKAMRS